MARSILAVIAGYLVMAGGVGALSGVMLTVFPGIYPEPGKAPSLAFMIVTLGYSAFGAVVGGYVTGVIAKRAEVNHALALGAIVVAQGIVAMIMFRGLQPVWYHQIALIVIVAPSVWLGGWLRGRRPNRVQG